MADISKININNTTYDIKDVSARNQLNLHESRINNLSQNVFVIEQTLPKSEWFQDDEWWYLAYDFDVVVNNETITDYTILECTWNVGVTEMPDNITYRKDSNGKMHVSVAAHGSTWTTIDPIVHLTIMTGDTSVQNAELVDIRVGADGTTYASAGDAVRGQIEDINNALNKTNILSANLFHGSLDTDTFWNCWTAHVYKQAQSNYKCGEFDIPTGAEYISSNFYWANNSFSAYVDDSYNKIGLVRDYVQSGNAHIYSVPEGATKVVFSFNYSDSTTATKLNNAGIVYIAGSSDIRTKTIVDYPYEGTVNYYADDLKLESEDNKSLSEVISSMNKTFYVKKDGSGDFTSLVSAINYINNNDIMDATLYVGTGTWDVIDELGDTYMNNVSSSSTTWGLVLKNRIHLIGSSQSLIVAKYTGSNTNVTTYFSVFNAGKYGFTLENVNIEDDNIRYSVHDDRGGSSFDEQYINRYINCSMKHTNGMYSDCIGGGLGIDGLIEIINCHFEGDTGRPRLAYYHGNNYRGETTAKCKIICTGNYFANDGTFKLTKYGDSTNVSTAYVSNNSFGSEPEVNSGSYAPQDNMQMVAWNNEVRSA